MTLFPVPDTMPDAWLGLGLGNACLAHRRAPVVMLGTWEWFGACPTPIPPQEKIVFWGMMVLMVQLPALILYVWLQLLLVGSFFFAYTAQHEYGD